MRVSLIFAFFALLFVSINAASDAMFRWTKQATSVDPSQCLNSCSNQGQCVSSTTSKTLSCLCDVPYIGKDCSLTASMKPLYYLTQQAGVYWVFNASDIVVRIAGFVEPAGWIGLMWGSTDGMSSGQSNIIHVDNIVDVTVEEMYNTKKGKPSLLPDQSISSASTNGVTGLNAAGLPFIDVTFSRALDTGMKQHFAIPATSGTITNMSVAFNAKYFEFHSKNATMDKVDIAQLAGVKLSLFKDE